MNSDSDFERGYNMVHLCVYAIWLLVISHNNQPLYMWCVC